jgi:hypothetical protein
MAAAIISDAASNAMFDAHATRCCLYMYTSVRARRTAAAIISDPASNAMSDAHAAIYCLLTSVRARRMAAAIISDAASNAILEAHVVVIPTTAGICCGLSNGRDRS